MYTFNIKLTFPIGHRSKTEIVSINANSDKEAMYNAFCQISNKFKGIDSSKIEFDNVEIVHDIYRPNVKVRINDHIIKDFRFALVVSKYGNEHVLKMLSGKIATIKRFGVDELSREYCVVLMNDLPDSLVLTLSTDSFEVIDS